MEEFRPAVEAILKENGCFPKMENGKVRQLGDCTIWWHAGKKMPVLVNNSIPTAVSANNTLSHIGLRRIFSEVK